MTPPLTQFFFTSWDGPTQPGSRDPLGLIPMWSSLGRAVIPHVRTTAGDVEGWLTLLLAVATAQEILPEMSTADRSRLPARVLIHQVEKLIGYSRLFGRVGTDGDSVKKVTGIRGQTRMTTALRSGVIAMNEPVLDNPISAGVWGQTSASARDAGLLTEHRRIEPVVVWGTDWNRRFDPIKARKRDVLALLTEAGATFQPNGQHQEVCDAWKRFFPRDSGEPYAEKLLSNLRSRLVEHTKPCAELARLLADQERRRVWCGTPAVGDVLGAARATSNANLHKGLAHIARVAQVIGPAELIFADMTNTGDTATSNVRKAVADLVRNRPGDERWVRNLQTGDLTDTDMWEVSEAWRSGDAPRVFDAVLRRHQNVMKRRAGHKAPWVREDGDQWRVLLKARAVPKASEAIQAGALVHNYYLSPFARLVRDINHGGEA